MRAQKLFNYLIAVGKLTRAKMNPKQCHPPAQRMEILGFLYDTIARSCKLSPKKQEKYISRINGVLQDTHVSGENLEKLVGNLTYAAWIAPFGRPFLSVLSRKIRPSTRKKPIFISSAMRNALVI